MIYRVEVVRSGRGKYRYAYNVLTISETDEGPLRVKFRSGFSRFKWLASLKGDIALMKYLRALPRSDQGEVVHQHDIVLNG